MSIERELLKKVISGDNKGDFFISYDLYKEIYEFLVHPEHTEQEQNIAVAIMPNGVCVSNVYDAYEAGRASVLLARPEQDNIQYLLDQVARLTAENAMLKEKWSTPKPESEQQPEAWIVVNKETGYRTQVSHFPDSYDKNTFEVIPLYTTPPKREPLSEDKLDVLAEANITDEGIAGYYLGFRDAEKHHGIGGE